VSLDGSGPFASQLLNETNRLVSNIFNGGFEFVRRIRTFALPNTELKHKALLYLLLMANHKSALKRIRSNEAKRVLNRYQHKSTRTAIKKLRGTTDKTAAQELLKKVTSMLDRLAKKNIIHKNKAANNKSKLTKLVNAL
jgi:small subunit ribosomal protein S20